MDPITHYIISWSIGRKLALEKNVYQIFLLSSVIPDIDAISIVFGVNYLLEFHGTITHSLAGGILLGLVVSLIFNRLRVFYWAVAGVLLHLSIDILINTGMVFEGGYPLLWPFSDTPCLLAYYTDIPILAFRTAYFSIAVASYTLMAYYISRKDYPWSVWLNKK